ncbi:MotA/TolQ/ExbB proton channel family protein [Teredinibacter turnerae]|uniref:MotA/TolQ/ExbB proton channel family protein n=1 Tax=Teredinibacter turnerae TaxID=2426 RepID=UPI0030D4753E
MADAYSIIVKFFQEGGFFLIPIAIVFFIGIAITVERWLFLAYEKRRNIKAFEDFIPLLRTTDMDKMQMYTRESTAPVVRIIGCGLDMMKVSKQRADVENAMNEGMLETLPRLEARTGYLAVLANVATLLGLLGTIIGLIGAFTAVANADPAEKSTLLSSSISVAMNTTAFGLIAAIPLLVLNAVIQNKTKKIVTSIEMSAVKFLNIMTLHRFIEAGMPRPEVTASPFGQAPQMVQPVVPAPQSAPNHGAGQINPAQIITEGNSVVTPSMSGA